LDVTIHIGRQKTGSTSIQLGLIAIRGQLAAKDILYPATLGKHKSKYIRDVFAAGRRLAGRADEVTAAFEKELTGGAALGTGRWRRLIISNENLCDSDASTMQSLAALVDGHGGKAQIYCYFRRPDEHVVSMYQQRVRTGGFSLPLDAFVERCLGGGYYDYAIHLDRWAKLFGKEAVHARVFHRSVLKENPFVDFVDWIGLSGEDLTLPAVDPRNESYDPVGVEVLRSLRRYLVESPSNFDEDLFYSFRKHLRHLNTDERLRLSPEQATRVWRASLGQCERLARDYLPDGEAEVLLAPPVAGIAPAVIGTDAVIARTIEVLARRGRFGGRFSGIRVRPVPSGLPPDAAADAELQAALSGYSGESARAQKFARDALAQLGAADGRAGLSAESTRQGEPAAAGEAADPYRSFRRLMMQFDYIPLWRYLRAAWRFALGRSHKTVKRKAREARVRRRPRRSSA
jgi:hypothetical protein